MRPSSAEKCARVCARLLRKSREESVPQALVRRVRGLHWPRTGGEPPSAGTSIRLTTFCPRHTTRRTVIRRRALQYVLVGRANAARRRTRAWRAQLDQRSNVVNVRCASNRFQNAAGRIAAGVLGRSVFDRPSRPNHNDAGAWNGSSRARAAFDSHCRRGIRVCAGACARARRPSPERDRSPALCAASRQ